MVGSPDGRRGLGASRRLSASAEWAAPSPVFNTFWSFAAERHRIYLARLRGEQPPWTLDPVLHGHRFTNVFRAADRVSQFLIREVVYSSDYSPDDLLMRIVLFRLFNRIETWELLRENAGEVTWSSTDLHSVDRLLGAALAAGKKIYSAAYIIPPPPLGAVRKHQNHLRLIEIMMRDELPRRLQSCASMEEAYRVIIKYPGLGPFLAYQLAVDINYSPLTDFDEMEFVVPGPGALRGIRKCFPAARARDMQSVIRLVADRQEELAAAFQQPSPRLWGRRMHLVDVQNLFCEVDKYARVAHPDVDGFGRAKIKQRFMPGRSLKRPWFPPKWTLNGLVEESLLAGLVAERSSQKVSFNEAAI